MSNRPDRPADLLIESPGQGQQDRARPQPLPPDRQRTHPQGSTQVHRPRRDDRQRGQTLRRHPCSRHRHSHLPLRRYSGGVGLGEGQEAAPVGGQGQGGEEPGRHILEVQVGLDELADILADELYSRASSPAGSATSPRSKTNTRGCGPSGPRRCDTSNARTARLSSVSWRLGAMTPPTPSSSPSRKTCASARGTRCASRGRTPRSFT